MAEKIGTALRDHAAKSAEPAGSHRSFTPGPWRTMDGDSVVNIPSPLGASIAATTSKTYYERFDATDKANARLIAAAPDLYEALAKLVDCCEAHPAFTKTDNIISHGRLIAARAALSRARGGE